MRIAAAGAKVSSTLFSRNSCSFYTKHDYKSISPWLATTDEPVSHWGHRRCVIGCDTTNDAARALYRRLGFSVTGIDKRSIFADGAYHDEERMTLDLDAA